MPNSLTGVFEDILAPIADKSGLPRDRVASTIGGQLIGTIIGDIYDKFTQGWFNTFLHLATGLGLIGATMYSKRMSPRLKEDLLEIGTIELMRLLNPRYWRGFKSSLKAWLATVKSGNYKAALNLMFKGGFKAPAPRLVTTTTTTTVSVVPKSSGSASVAPGVEVTIL